MIHNLPDLIHEKLFRKRKELMQLGFINSEFAIYMTQETYKEFLNCMDSRYDIRIDPDSKVPIPQFLGHPVFIVLQTNDKAHKDFQVVITKLD